MHLDGLPDFLRTSIRKGLIDETTARRIELYRRTRGEEEEIFALASITPDPEMTFDHFVRFKGNEFALDLARAVTGQSPSSKPYNPLYIHSDVGLGKTHLLSAIANEVSMGRVLMVNTADLGSDLRRADKLAAVSDLLRWLISFEILLVDDIQLCEGNENLQLMLFSILNHMTTSGGWVVITSDAYPTSLVGIESRLLSRFRGGIIVGLQRPNKAERLQIVRHFLQGRQWPEEVIDYLATKITDNLRQLRAAVYQLQAMAGYMNCEITIDMAWEVVHAPGGWSVPPDHENQTGDRSDSPAFKAADQDQSAVSRFKEMVAVAETEEEQVLALQIALGERIRQLRASGGDPATLQKLEHGLAMLRDGGREVALKCLLAL